MKPLGGGNHHRIDKAKRQVGILVHQRRGARDVFRLKRFGEKFTVRNRADEGVLRRRADASLQEVADFRQHSDRHNDRA